VSSKLSHQINVKFDVTVDRSILLQKLVKLGQAVLKWFESKLTIIEDKK